MFSGLQIWCCALKNSNIGGAMTEVKCQSNDYIKIMMVLIDLHIGVTYGEDDRRDEW